MGLKAYCEPCNIAIILVIQDKVVPEPVDVDFWSSIDEECKNSL